MIAKENNISEIATYRGRLEKSIAQMTQSEREEHYKVSANRTREFLFSIGQPLVHQKNGYLVAEYADGKITIIR